MSLNTAANGITHGEVHNSPQSALELISGALFEDIHFLMDQCQTQSLVLETGVSILLRGKGNACLNGGISALLYEMDA